MNIWYLYFIITALCFALSTLIHIKVGRNIWAMKLSLFRQVTILIVGAPIIISLIPKIDLVSNNWLWLILSWICGTSYLLISFQATNITSVGISRSFVTVSRTITAFVIGFFIFKENITLIDIAWIWVIALGFYILAKDGWEKLTKSDTFWIILSLIWGAIFSINMYVFKIFSDSFSALESAFLLELMNGFFLILVSIFYGFHKKNLRSNFHIWWKQFFAISLWAPLVLLWWYTAATSIHMVPFYLFNSLLVLILILLIILSWIFLKEKISITRWISLWIIISWCLVMILF